MFCKDCGSETNTVMRYCNNCGSELLPPESEPMQYTQMPQAAPAPQQYGEAPQYNPGHYPVQKKSNMGLIITAVIISVVVVIGGALVFIFRDSLFGSQPSPAPSPGGGGVVVSPGRVDPTPTPTPTDLQMKGTELEGSWVSGTGDVIYGFWDGTDAVIELHGDGFGVFKVYDMYGDLVEDADWKIDSNGDFFVTSTYEFYYTAAITYSLTGNVLTLIDEDGDVRTFRKS